MNRDDAFAAWRATLSVEGILGIYFAQNPHQRAYSVCVDEVKDLLLGVLFGPRKIGDVAGQGSLETHLRTACNDELSGWFDENEGECMEALEPREEGLSAAEGNPSLLNRAGWGGLA